MLTTNEYLNIEDYAFKSSPESCSGNSCFTDSTDLPSDEDFLQQLSSDLDIPLLLNPGEDELSLLNSFFDKSPEEIMSEIVLPESPKEVNSYEPPKSSSPKIKIEQSDSFSSSSSNKSISPIQSPDHFFEIKDEVKYEPHSPSYISGTLPTVHKTEIDGNVFITTSANPVQIVPSLNTLASSKGVPIQPKNKVVVVKNSDLKRGPTSALNSPPQKVVVLENFATVPITNVTPISTTTVSSEVGKMASTVIFKNEALTVGNIDPKILKRHQRKIKNRESASLSRKKKKDYLTSLETQVKELMHENQQLKLENQQLKERLTKYEDKPSQKNSGNVRTNIVLCMFLFSVAFHLDYIRNPLFSRSQTNMLDSKLPKISSHGRNLLWTSEEVSEKNSSKFSPFTMCPALVNQTESARLALELERWIGQPNDLSSEKIAKTSNVTKLSVSLKPKLRKRKKKYQTALFPSVYENRRVAPKISDNKNEIQVFSPTPEQLYTEFFEAINRQDDTFYVVSLSEHHLLLPALHHNKTRRPKMSLIMPSVLPNENTTQPAFVPLMQIDCEVLDTRLIQIRYGSIPQHLRKNGNATYQNSESKQDTNANYTTRKAYKPYFIRQKNDVYNIS